MSVQFAAERVSSFGGIRSNDLARAASIGGLDAAVRAATTSAMRGESRASISSGLHDTHALADESRLTGRVKFFDAAKGYGYISADSGDDYFFNPNGFKGEAPRKGDRVEFQPAQGPKGLMAKRILAAITAA